jgi:hypothetical protein
MKTLAATIAVILLTSSVALAQWKKQDGTPVENTPDRKSVGTFGAHLLVVKDPKAFIEDWQKPETPHINPVTATQRGELLGGIILFAGCKSDEKGACNAEVDYSVYRPDGSLYAEQKAQSLWKETAPGPQIIQLGEAILAIRFEKDDPAGEYKIKAKVSDLNANITFDLETKIRLQ